MKRFGCSCCGSAHISKEWDIATIAHYNCPAGSIITFDVANEHATFTCPKCNEMQRKGDIREHIFDIGDLSI